MTIRLLTKWSDYEANTIITESPETEAGLLAGKQAMAELAGGIYTTKNKPTAIRVVTSAPSKRPDVHRSAMYIGDSISAATISMAHLPRNKAVRWMTAATPNLNTDGAFVKEVLTAATCPSGNGTLRFYAADSTMPTVSSSQHLDTCRTVHVGFRYRNTRDYNIYVKLDSQYDYAHASYFHASWDPTYQKWQTSDYTYYDSWWSSTDTVATVVSSVPSVPEPTTFAMLGLGLSIIGLSRRRINANAS